jgi:hypothetical protein
MGLFTVIGIVVAVVLVSGVLLLALAAIASPCNCPLCRNSHSEFD